MKTIPIKKTILATLAFTFSNWQKLLEVSIFPFLMALPLITILPELMIVLQAQLFGIGEVGAYPDYYQLYLLMFDYGYMALVINIYRMVISGNNSIARLGVVLPSLRFGRFFLLFILLSIAIQFPIFISPFLLPVIYFLLIPISLNLVSIANDVPYKKIKLQLSVQLRVFLLKLGVPTLLIVLVTLIGANEFTFWGSMVIVIYWMAISFALCYSVIMANNSKQNP